VALLRGGLALLRKTKKNLKIFTKKKSFLSLIVFLFSKRKKALSSALCLLGLSFMRNKKKKTIFQSPSLKKRNLCTRLSVGPSSSGGRPGILPRKPKELLPLLACVRNPKREKSPKPTKTGERGKNRKNNHSHPPTQRKKEKKKKKPNAGKQEDNSHPLGSMLCPRTLLSFLRFSAGGAFARLLDSSTYSPFFALGSNPCVRSSPLCSTPFGTLLKTPSPKTPPRKKKDANPKIKKFKKKTDP